MKDYASRQRTPQKRLVGIGLLVGLHVLVLVAVNSGMGRDLFKKAKPPVEALLLDEVKPDIPPPPPPPPPPPQKQLPPPPDYIPPVEVRVQSAPAVNAIAAVQTTVQTMVPPTAVPMVAAPAPAPAPVTAPVRVAPVINAAANCEKPEYPTVSRRQQEEGTVQLKFLIGLDGRVIESEIEKSSSFRRLDEAARAGLSKCQFKPGTFGGKPEQSWATVRYIWRLEE